MRQFIIIIIVFLCSMQAAYCGIDLRNGNFYISYIDLEFPGSKAEITRSYNSNSSHKGLFGYGWGTLLETKLHALPDGSLILKWWGTGQGDYYEAALVNRQGLYAMTSAVIANLIRTNKLENNPVAIAEKKSYLLVNHQERATKYIEMQLAKLAPAYTPPSNWFTWTLDVNQVIHWDGKKFEAKSWEDRYVFNSTGQLTTIADRNYKMIFSYKGNYLSGILVDEKYACSIETDSTGKITRLDYADSGLNKVAVFKYDKLDNLVYSKDAGDNQYRFSYDLYHNLIRIDYEDKTFVEMSYDAANNRVRKFRDRNGSFQTYQYPYFYTAEGNINYQHYATDVKKYDSLGNVSFAQYKEFENRFMNDGSTYLHRMLEKTDSSFHEVLYAAEVGNAWYRKTNRGQAWSQYDSKKRPTYLRINDSVYRCTYNQQDLPGYFLAVDSSKRDSIKFVYRYSNDGKLIEVVKNKAHYIISGSKEEKKQIIRKGTEELTVRFLNDKPYSIENKKWGMTLIDDEALQKMDPTIEHTKREHITREEQTTVSTGPDQKAQTEKSVAARSDHPQQNRQSLSETIPPDNRSKLLELYKEFLDVMVPKHIMHEWIWERL